MVSACAVPDTELPEAAFVLPCLKQERLCKDSGGAKNNRISTPKPCGRATDTNYFSILKCNNSYSQIQQQFMHTSIAKHNLKSRKAEKQGKNIVIPEGIWPGHWECSRPCQKLFSRFLSCINSFKIVNLKS